MARKNKNKNNNNNTNTNNTDVKEYKKLRIDDLVVISPITERQKFTFEDFASGHHLMLHGVAGSGKTFLSLYLALEQALDPSKEFNKVVIVRSVVPTRDMGFLKGTDDDKISVYEAPYITICRELFGYQDAYYALKEQGVIEFHSTSFIRGVTIDNAVVVVDECENLNFHELDSVMTRPGEVCRLIYCGDYAQSDFTNSNEKNGLLTFMRIIKALKQQFSFIEFIEDDIVRSDLVKSYIIMKNKLGLSNYGKQK